MFDKHSTQRLLCNKQAEDNMQLKTTEQNRESILEHTEILTTSSFDLVPLGFKLTSLMSRQARCSQIRQLKHVIRHEFARFDESECFHSECLGQLRAMSSLFCSFVCSCMLISV